MPSDASARLIPPPSRQPNSLEDAALDLLTRIPRSRPTASGELRPLFSREQARALARRKGWDGRPGGTLQDAGDLIGVSRERVRQLEVSLDKWLDADGACVEAVPGVVSNAIEVALSAGSDAPAGELLKRRKLAMGRWTIASLAQLLKVCHRDDLDGVVTAAAELSAINDLASTAVWLASAKLGFAHRDAVRRQLADELGRERMASLSDEAFDALLGSSEGVMVLPHGYYFAAPYRDPTIVETICRMLQVAQPLALRDVRAGLRRRCRFRKIPFRVPTAVLRRFLELSEEFEVDDADAVRMVTERLRTGETLQWWLVDEMRGSDYGMLTRNQVMERARRARKNMNSVGSYLTYGDQIAHDPRGFYYPIGCPPPESVVVDALEVAGATTQRTSQSWHYDRERGIVTALVELGDSVLSSGVVFVDLPSRPYLDLLGDSHYAIRDEEGATYGNLRRSEPMNAVFGLATLFTRTYPEPGDLLRLEIDLGSLTALAEVGGSELEPS